jgi:hypothetical protein
MATVRFSQALTDDILATASKKLQPAVQRVYDSRPDHSWGDKIYDKIFADDLHLVRQLPTYWCKAVDSILVDTVGGLNINMKFNLTTPQLWPASMVDNAVATTNVYSIGRVVLKDHLVWGELHAAASEYNKRVTEVLRRQSEFVASVKKIITSYTTLAPALKAWPPLWDLLDQDTKSRHKEVKSSPKVTATPDVDFDKLTAQITAAKLIV